MTLPTPYYEEEGITVYCADCRDVLPFVGRFDLCLTDPPYGIGAAGMTLGNGTRPLERAGGLWDDSRPSALIFSLMAEISTSRIIWGGNYFADLFPPTRGWLVWDKLQSPGIDFADCELAWTNIDTVARVFRLRPQSMDGGKIHPTQKPVKLMLWCIEKAKNPQSIIDPFLGSGTTLVAAKRLGIRAVGIEREERYCKIAVERIKTTTPSLFDERREL